MNEQFVLRPTHVYTFIAWFPNKESIAELILISLIRSFLW